MKGWKHVSPKKLSARKRGIFVSNNVVVARRDKWRTFSEKSMEYWRQYICGFCKHLVFRRDLNRWACEKGHAATKEYCGDLVDDTQNIRIRYPDGSFMYLSEE
jgi:hypothetical protein